MCNFVSNSKCTEIKNRGLTGISFIPFWPYPASGGIITVRRNKKSF